jgi:two-component system, NtrC family, nitrogen regulation sensor histidine kinase NtrY
VKRSIDRTALTENTSRGLVILLVLFMILIGVIIVFSRTFISTLAYADPAVSTIALLVALALPALLLGVTIFQLVRLLRQRATHHPGAGLRLRLLLFFIVVSVLSAGPQAMLGITFVNSAMGTWFSSPIGDALHSALDRASAYYDERLQGLAAFIDGPLAPGLVRDFAAAPDKVWPAIQQVNTGIGALQVFSQDGREAAFRGDERARVSSLSEARAASGMKEDKEQVSLLRSKARTFTVGGRQLTAVASAVLPADLRTNVRKVTQSLTIFAALDQFGNLFRIVLVGFFFLFSLPIFFITILVSLLLTERIISPIVHLEDATRRVAEGDFGFRILTRPRDELSNLVDSFNGMISELERSRRKLLQAERITAWQEIAQRLAHEIRNPLTPIKLSAQRILKKHSEGAEDFDKVLSPAVSSIITEVENLEWMLREFGEFAKLPVPQAGPVNLKEMVTEVASVYAHLSANVRIDMKDVPPSVVLSVDRNQMKRVFANLFTNAIQAMPNGGLLSVRADLVKKAHGGFYRIAVSDTGSGIDELDMDSIFDPYFTTKKNGTGLGLAIVQRIVFDHQGNVWAESDGSSGTTFFIDLPAGERAAAPAPGAAAGGVSG